MLDANVPLLLFRINELSRKPGGSWEFLLLQAPERELPKTPFLVRWVLLDVKREDICEVLELGARVFENHCIPEQTPTWSLEY